MGGGGSKFSIPVPPPPTPPPPPPPPPDPRAVREQKRVELTMAKNDVKDKQIDYDKIAPDEASQRKINEATPVMNAFVSDKQTKLDYELQLFNTSLNQLDALSNNASFILAQKYKKTLKKRYNDISQEYTKHKEIAFTNRRRFNDSDPQEGVNGVGWFSSVDEQVLVAFWTGYIIFVGVILSFVVEYVRKFHPVAFSIYGPSWAGSLAVIVIATHMIIKATI